MKSIPYPLRGAWLITEEGRDIVMGVWETAHATGKAERIALALEARDGEPFKNQRNCVVTDGVAVMDIDGPLMRKAELFSDISGATSYQWIGATADALRTDPSVKAVIIRANSPGGEAAGTGECAEKIARLAAEKRVEGYVETQAASAMYWLLSQCSHITAHPTAQVGWIGAVRDMFDTSKRDEKDGVKRIQFVSKGAEEKRTHPIDKSLTDRVQRTTDEWGQLFYAAVAEGRGVSVDTVVEDFGTGYGMFAAEALDVGLIDEIGDFESVLARMSTSTPDGVTYASRPTKGATRMAKPNDGTRAADADNEWKCAGCSEMMGPSATKYCAKCAEDDDGDDDGDEDEAKALGLDAKASRGTRRARIDALTALEAKLAITLKCDARDHAAIVQMVADSASAGIEVAKIRAEAQKTALRTCLERGLAGANGKAPTLSLGQIQKNLPAVLRGETRKAWVAAMDKVAVDAEAAKAGVTAAQIVDAACSVKLSAEDIESIQGYVETASPVAAATFKEPHRDGEKESAELDETSRMVAEAAKKARATLDRNNPTAAK